MSQTYPDLTSTQFPDNTDTINNFVDITLATLPLAQEYYKKYNAGDIAGANTILQNNPSLKYSQINSSTLNPLVDSIKALERFYMSDVQKYLMDIVVYKGEWSASVKYTKYNTVKYVNASAFEIYMCSTNNIPIGTLPTDTAYWIPLTMRGEKGEAGIGLSAYGSWNSVITYPKDAMVAYNNAIWGSKVSNTGITPSLSTTATWYLIIEFGSNYVTYTDNITQVRRKLKLDNNTVYMEDETNGDKLSLVTQAQLPTSLPANGGNADKLDGQEGSYYLDYNNFTNKPSSLPANGGNADTLDGIESSGFVINTGSEADVNTIITSGVYRVNSNANLPPNCAYGQLLVMHGTGDTITQVYGQYSTGELWTRSGNSADVGGSGTWTAWTRTNDNGNALTVNGFNITSTTDIPSSLTNNTLCFVYE